MAVPTMPASAMLNLGGGQQQGVFSISDMLALLQHLGASQNYARPAVGTDQGVGPYKPGGYMPQPQEAPVVVQRNGNYAAQELDPHYYMPKSLPDRLKEQYGFIQSQDI